MNPPEANPAETPRPRLAALGILISLALAVLLPLVFAEVMLNGLRQLHLSPQAALAVLVAMFVGALINIPVRRIAREYWVVVDPLAVFGLGGVWRALQRRRTQTVIAVNVGGCLVPLALVAYELFYLAPKTQADFIALGVPIILNIALCFVLSRPVPGVGIVMPVGAPALLAAVSSMILSPANPAPAAFIAGTLGPLIGADLLHLRAVERSFVGVASIGGAGTFDGIVLSGLLAAYLA